MAPKPQKSQKAQPDDGNAEQPAYDRSERNEMQRLIESKQ
jgi:hypothetical protein